MRIDSRACWKGVVVTSLFGCVGVAPAQAGYCPGVAVPAYFYPVAATGLWAQVVANVRARTRFNIMVMNPASGPGAAVNSDYVAAVNSARSSGIKVLGYVHTSYGTRSSAIVKSEIDAYKNWYGVDGIFIDETMANPTYLSYYSTLASYIRSARGDFVMLNPGVFPTMAKFIEMADTTVVFEGTYATYSTAWIAPPAWAPYYPASKYTHLVYGASATNMASALTLAKARNAGQVYVTDDVLPNPWDTLPSYSSTLLAAIISSCLAAQ